MGVFERRAVAPPRALVAFFGCQNPRSPRQAIFDRPELLCLQQKRFPFIPRGSTFLLSMPAWHFPWKIRSPSKISRGIRSLEPIRIADAKFAAHGLQKILKKLDKQRRTLHSSEGRSGSSSALRRASNRDRIDRTRERSVRCVENRPERARRPRAGQSPPQNLRAPFEKYSTLSRVEATFALPPPPRAPAHLPSPRSSSTCAGVL